MLMEPTPPSPTTSFPDRHERRIVVLNVFADGQGAAMAATVDGYEKVFISARTVATLGIEPGQFFTALIQANTVRPDKTPWFAIRLTPEDAGAGPALRESILAVLLEEGGAWTPRKMADWCACSVPAAEAALEVIYANDTRVAKVVLFKAKESNGRRIWFTAVPDRIDVDEFEEEAE
jgi:hypothetical protein